MLLAFRCVFRSHLKEECRVLSNAFSSGRFDGESKTHKKNLLNLRSEVLKKNKIKYEDTFGDIDKFERIFQMTKEDPEDILEYERESAAQGKKIIEYLEEIKAHLRNNDYKSALKILEVDMANDKKRANQFIYRILINHNALAGNLKEAYRLFLRFKERQGIANGAMYTSMFNACANCKNSFLALEKAKAVRECMEKNKHHAANITNYNVMLKAFGRHGDITTCLKIMDEVLERKDKVKNETYVFLLQACASDSNSGLRFGLLTWRKMLQNKVKPNIYVFNTMLRCIRDCSLGDALLIPELMKEVIEESDVFYKRKVKIETIGDEARRTVTKILTDGSGLTKPVEENLSISQVKSLDDKSFLEKTENIESATEPNLERLNNLELPNFLSLNPKFGSVIDFGVMTEPYHRLMLAGGVKGFLKTMDEFGVKPDIKTFTLLLQIIPSTLEAEEELMSLVVNHKLQFDINFFNVLTKKRILRNEHASIKNSLEQMRAFNIKPDIYTFGILAMNCDTRESGMELLTVIQSHGFSLNPPIMTSLLRNALRTNDLNYILHIVRTARENGTKLDFKFMSMLSNFVEKTQHLKKEEKEEFLFNDKNSLRST